MKYILSFLFAFLIFSLSFAQTKTVIIPPSKDTARVTIITTTTTTTDTKVDYLPSAPGNKPPIASAGNDVAVTLPVNTVTLSAVGSSDADGSISSYKWSQVSGGAANLTQVNTAANVSGLTQGVYVFRVTVTDNGGLIDTDEVTVVVNPAPSEPGTRQNVVYEALFNGNSPFPSSALYKQACCGHSVQQSKTTVREGDGSFRAESRSNDPSVSGGYRPEFIPLKNSSSQVDRLADAWYGYSMYFEDWKSCSCGEHVMQWHPDNGTGSAVLGIYTNANTFHIRLNPEGDATAFTVKDGMQIKPNKWYDMVWHVVWSGDKTKGRIELWIDGEKYVDYTGATLTRGGLPYFKIGINRWNMRENRVLYIDAVRIANEKGSYKDVVP